MMHDRVLCVNEDLSRDACMVAQLVAVLLSSLMSLSPISSSHG
jgi:hypothetical protein